MATAAPRKTKYIARTAFSIGEVNRYNGEVERRADLIQRGGDVYLTDEQYERLKRFVVLPDEDLGPRIQARDAAQVVDAPTKAMVDNALKATGALPISSSSAVVGEVASQPEANEPVPQTISHPNIGA